MITLTCLEFRVQVLLYCHKTIQVKMRNIVCQQREMTESANDIIHTPNLLRIID